MDNDMKVDPSSGYYGHDFGADRRFKRRAPKHKAIILRSPKKNGQNSSDVEEAEAKHKDTGRHLDIVV